MNQISELKRQAGNHEETAAMYQRLVDEHQSAGIECRDRARFLEKYESEQP